MQELDLGDEVQVKVKWRGKEYVLREPTVKELEDLRDVDHTKIDVVGFLGTLGMPIEETRSMGASKARALIDGLMDLATKKK